MLIVMIINKGKNLRNSKQRDRILKILKDTKTHPTADWIYSKLKPEFTKLSQGTVYRNLGILLKIGKIKKITSGSTFDRYEANLEPHYHLVCERCNSITDFYAPGCEDILKNAKKVSGFLIKDFQIEFHGICNICRKKYK